MTVERDAGEMAELPLPATRDPGLPVPLAEYHPNNLRADFDAPDRGIFVVTDSPFPG